MNSSPAPHKPGVTTLIENLRLFDREYRKTIRAALDFLDDEEAAGAALRAGARDELKANRAATSAPAGIVEPPSFDDVDELPETEPAPHVTAAEVEGHRERLQRRRRARGR